MQARKGVIARDWDLNATNRGGWASAMIDREHVGFGKGNWGRGGMGMK